MPKFGVRYRYYSCCCTLRKDGHDRCRWKAPLRDVTITDGIKDTITSKKLQALPGWAIAEQQAETSSSRGLDYTNNIERAVKLGR